MPQTSTHPSPCFIVICETGVDHTVAEQIQETLQAVDIIEKQVAKLKQLPNVATHIVNLEPHPTAQYKISIAATHNPKQKLSVDFTTGPFGYRLQNSNSTKQPLAKAVGLSKLLHKGVRPLIMDATAGLGRDGFILASLGCQVELLERTAIIYLLLSDGLRRARLDNRSSEICERITLLKGDAIQYLKTNNNLKHDIIYLDPMYPHRDKSALVKKEMRLTRELIGDDMDAEELFACAMASGVNRVIVKRPKLACALGSKKLKPPKPNFNIPGKTTRFDVYQCR